MSHRCVAAAISSLIIGSVSNAGICQRNEDCSLLGICESGHCVCDKGWMGSDCAAANLRPWAEGNGYHNASAASWGGRAVLHTDGNWRLFVCEIDLGCPLLLFQNNSMVVRAVSHDGPLGPFKHEATVLPAFAHNPSIIGPTDDGHYLLFFIGNEMDPSTELNCAQDGVPTEGCFLPPFDAPGHRCRPRSNYIISMAWSTSVEGPWQQRVILDREHDGNQSRWDCLNNNPSATILKNGTVLLIYRANNCVNPSGGEALGVAVAKHWSSDFVRREDPILTPEDGFGSNEDPFLWQDRRGNFHIVSHQQGEGNICGDKVAGHSCGAHLYSTDGLSWGVSSTPVYSATVTLANESKATFQTRQRPQIIFDEAGHPLVLYNAGSFDGNNLDAIMTHTYAFSFEHNVLV